jgi:transcriptional regulator with XRE-family HTH domain
MYLLFMKKKKNPGPSKGRTHNEVKRSPFGERLFRTRKARGLSQTELGEMINLSKRMISHYEGDAPEGPPLTTLNRIAEALNVTVSYLLGESTLKTIKDDLKPAIQKHMKIVQELDTKDQKKVFEYIELLSKKSHNAINMR